MAKSKYKLHKIKIHHNRWLLWAIAYAIIVAIALVGYIKVSDINLETQLIAESEFRPWHIYTNPQLGFSLRYPVHWAIDVNSDASIDFFPIQSQDAGVTVAVANFSAEKALRKHLKIKSEHRTLVDNVSGAEIENDLGQGHSEAWVLVRHNRKLYLINGTKTLVDQLLLTFNFLSQK